MARNGTGFQTLRHLAGFGDAATPDRRLLQLTNGLLIGTSAAGGTAGLGSIFVIQTNGTGYTIVRSFLSTGSDARSPIGGLAPAGDGSLLGPRASEEVRQQVPYSASRGTAASTPFCIDSHLITLPVGTVGVPECWFFRHNLRPSTLGGLSSGGAIFRLSILPKLAVQSGTAGFEVTWPDTFSDFELQMNTT